MTGQATPAKVRLTDGLGPVAEVKCGRLQWAIPRDDYRLPLRFLNNDTHPLYDQASLDAAVAAERERCAMEVWCAMQEATADDADDKGLEGWMREAEQRIRNRA